MKRCYDAVFCLMSNAGVGMDDFEYQLEAKVFEHQIEAFAMAAVGTSMSIQDESELKEVVRASSFCNLPRSQY